MSSIQASIPLATNKILNAIKLQSMEVFDYYIDFVSTYNDPEIRYYIFLKYINGINYCSLLDLNGMENIPYCVFFNNKIYTTLDLIYYPVVKSDNGHNKIVLTRDRIRHNDNVFEIPTRLVGRSYDTDFCKLERYYYNDDKKEATLAEDQSGLDGLYLLQEPSISCVSKDADGTIRNAVYYITELPTKITNAQECYKVIPLSETT